MENFFTPDSLVGYRLKGAGQYPALRIHRDGDTIYKVHYTIYEDSAIQRSPFPFRKAYHAGNGRREVVFLGCSFTMGEGLPDESTLPYQFGRMSNVSSVNRGVNGYGLHQVYQLYHSRYTMTENKDKVFVYSFIPDHFLRATGIYEWNSTGPHFAMEKNRLVNLGVFPHRRHVKINRLAHYASGLSTLSFIRDYIKDQAPRHLLKSLKEDSLTVYYQMVLDMASHMEMSGARLVILFWDHDRFRSSYTKLTDPSLVLKKMEKLLEGTSVRIIPVSTILDYGDQEIYILDDGHPSGKANRLIAERLKGELSPWLSISSYSYFSDDWRSIHTGGR